MSHIEWAVFAIFIALVAIWIELRRWNGTHRHNSSANEQPKPFVRTDLERGDGEPNGKRCPTTGQLRRGESTPSRVAPSHRRQDVEVNNFRNTTFFDLADLPEGKITLPPDGTWSRIPQDEMDAIKKRLLPLAHGEEPGDQRRPIVVDLGNLPQPDFSTGTVVFALLCNKSAIGIYTDYEKAEEARDAFKNAKDIGFSDVLARHLYQIKPFKLDNAAMMYLPY